MKSLWQTRLKRLEDLKANAIGDKPKLFDNSITVWRLHDDYIQQLEVCPTSTKWKFIIWKEK